MRVCVVHGSPLSGKSSYVAAHIKDGDLVYDYDAIMSAISGLPMHGRNPDLHSYVTAIRDLIIAKLKSETRVKTAWIIITKPTDDFRRSLTGLNPEFIEMRVDIDTARARLAADPGGRDQAEWSAAIDRYFTAVRDYSDFYARKEWRRKRAVILKRDDYQCRECKRYGKPTPADEVHHVLPISERPDLRLVNNNLLSLCREHHDLMHNRFDGSLSKLGMEVRGRTLRRHPELGHGAGVSCNDV